jgi:uncharacterized repeat protein (TIGR02543 family)
MRNEKGEIRNTNEKLKVKDEQWMEKEYFFSLFTVLCSLFIFSACQDPLKPSQAENIPAGKGSLSLSITVADSARTILPGTPSKNDFALYALMFEPTIGSPHNVDRLPAELSEPFFLEPGTYSITVTAFFDTDKALPAARGSVSGIVISEGNHTPANIDLEAIIAGYEGSFTYTVNFDGIADFPANMETAKMVITPLNTLTGTHPEDVDFLSDGLTTDTITLNTGSYNVMFILEKKDGNTLVWRELLYVYASLNSIYFRNFTDTQFSEIRHTVTYIFNNGDDDGIGTVNHGGTINKSHVPTKEGHAFGGWYTDPGLTSEYDPNTPVTGDITLYAKWNETIVTGITLNKTSATIFLGDTETLTATVEPSNALNKTVIWESSDEDVATVDDGVVTAITAGTAIITVISDYDNSKTATCTITAVFPKPLVEDQWEDGEITTETPNKEDWYSIEVENEATYYFYWNDTDNYWGTLDIKVAASYKGEITIFDVDNPGSNYQSFTATSTGTVYIRVYPYGSSNTTGTYSIVYNTTGTRPSIDWSPYTPILLIEDQWEDGEITTDTPNREDWYSIEVTAGTTYYFWWNDSSWGDGTKTLNIKVSAWYENGNIVFSDKASNINVWDMSRAFTPVSNGIVYIRVTPSNSSATGTYGIVYSTSGRPGWTPPFGSKPLIEDIWVDGNITTETLNREDWYSIGVTVGTTYYLWWNDSDNNNSTGFSHMDIKVAALYSGAIQIFDVDNSSSNYQSFTSTSTGTVYVRVYPYSSGSTGTYGIVYSTTNTRPDMNNTAVIFIEIDVEIIKDITFTDIEGGTIHRDSDNGAQTIDLEYTGPGSCTWSIKEVGTNITITESGNTFTVDATDTRYNSLGRHAVYLVVWIDDVPYSKTIWVMIEQ